MRSSLLLVSMASFAAAAAVLGACGSGKAPSKPEDAGPVGQAFSYTGKGCDYAVSPPESRAFEELALDETAPAEGDGAVPERVRIGLGGGTTMGKAGYADPSKTAAFTWETRDRTRSAKVRLGAEPGALTDVRTGYVFTTPKPTVGFGTNEPVTYMHEVHVCGLEPGKTYYYQVGGGAAGAEVWSATQSFTTVPTTGKITVGISGDARDKVEIFGLVQKKMKEAGVSLQLMSGDLVDIGGLSTLYRTWLDAVWRDPADSSKFLTLGQQMWVPIAGNHENEAVRFYGNFAIPGEGDLAETYASFNVGNTHFVMFDDQQVATQPTGDTAAAQIAWLDLDLGRANADRVEHPFIVVVSHRGLYTTSLHAADGDVLLARGKLAPIFDKHHVDLVINGHDHEFERSKPLKAGADPSGPPVVQASPAEGTVYVVNAGSGADPYGVAIYDSPFREKAEAFDSNGGCYALMELEGRKLTLKSFMLGATDTPVDTFELTR